MKLEELRKIKEQAKRELDRKQKGKGGKRVVVGMGTCGIGVGAREVMEAILDEISTRGIADIEVTQTGCAGYCAHEPMVTVIDESGSVAYGKVTPEDAREIVKKHLLRGTVLGHLVFEPI